MDKKPKLFGRQLQLSWSEILLGCLIILAGLLLVIWPEFAATVIPNGIGIVAIVCGAVYLFRYFRMDKGKSLDSNQFAVGLIWIVCGALLIALRTLLVSLLPFLCGLIVVIGGILKLQATLSFKRMNVTRWYLELVCAGASIVLGALIMFNPFSTALILVRIIGVALIVEGVLDLFSRAAFVKARSAYVVETTVSDAPTSTKAP